MRVHGCKRGAVPCIPLVRGKVLPQTRARNHSFVSFTLLISAMAGRLAVSMLQQGLQPVRMGLLKRALPASSLALPTSSCSRAFSAQAATEAPAKIPDSELMNHFRLRTKRRWVDFAPYVVNIKFSFDPSLDGTTGCK